jgi:hypothetical protein
MHQQGVMPMDTWLEVLRWLHSWTRWLALLVIVVALVYFARGLLQKRAWSAQAAQVLGAFSGVIGIQWLIGIVFLISVFVMRGDFGVRQHWEHAFAQTVAIAIAESHRSWRKRDWPDAIRWRNGLLLMLGVLGVVILGIFAISPLINNPNGAWRFYFGS